MKKTIMIVKTKRCRVLFLTDEEACSLCGLLKGKLGQSPSVDQPDLNIEFSTDSTTDP